MRWMERTRLRALGYWCWRRGWITLAILIKSWGRKLHLNRYCRLRNRSMDWIHSMRLRTIYQYWRFNCNAKRTGRFKMSWFVKRWTCSKVWWGCRMEVKRPVSKRRRWKIRCGSLRRCWSREGETMNLKWKRMNWNTHSSKKDFLITWRMRVISGINLKSRCKVSLLNTLNSATSSWWKGTCNHSLRQKNWLSMSRPTGYSCSSAKNNSRSTVGTICKWRRSFWGLTKSWVKK